MEGKDGRTERATGRRRSQERRKGNLAISPEIMTLASLLTIAVSLRMAWPGIRERFGSLITNTFMGLGGQDWTARDVMTGYGDLLKFAGAVLAPILLPVMLAGMISSVAQTGPYFSMQTLKLKWSSLNPVSGLKKIFGSSEAIFKLVMQTLKIALVVVIAYLVVRRQVSAVPALAHSTAMASAIWMGDFIYQLILWILLPFIGVAVLDWIWRKYQHERGMMMTKEEVRDERRQQETSPLVRKAQMRKMREFSLMRMMADVPKATVVITNPTHVAVALEYDPETMDAPVVRAKGLRLVAARIKRIAREHNIPIIERPEVARSLYKYAKIGKEIPPGFFEAVADILAFLYRIGRGIRVA